MRRILPQPQCGLLGVISGCTALTVASIACNLTGEWAIHVHPVWRTRLTCLLRRPFSRATSHGVARKFDVHNLDAAYHCIERQCEHCLPRASIRLQPECQWIELYVDDAGELGAMRL